LRALWRKTAKFEVEKRTPISGFLGKKGHLFSTEDTCISEEDTDETSNNGRQ
jgi:hypothetical protein